MSEVENGCLAIIFWGIFILKCCRVICVIED